MGTSHQTFTRTMMQKVDVPATRYETVVAITEVHPNAVMGRHTHPGLETGYVLQGSGTLSVDGQPALTLKAGQSWNVAPNAVHDLRAGPDGAKVLATWVVEKGKPLASDREPTHAAA